MLSIWQTSFGSRLDFIGKCDIIYIVFSFMEYVRYFHFGYEPFILSLPSVEILDLLSHGLAVHQICWLFGL